MGYSQFDIAGQRPAWNKGRRVGPKRPLTQKQIWARTSLFEPFQVKEVFSHSSACG